MEVPLQGSPKSNAMKPRTNIEVIGSRSTLSLSAVIDTGFSVDLCLPTEIAVGLGLELTNRHRTELADGSVHAQLVFAGRVKFVGEERDVDIYLTDLDEALIGTGLMDDCRLTIDFAKGTVDLKKSNKKGPR